MLATGQCVVCGENAVATVERVITMLMARKCLQILCGKWQPLGHERSHPLQRVTRHGAETMKASER